MVLVYIAECNLNESLNVIWGGKTRCTINSTAINDPKKRELLLCQEF